MTAGIPGIGLGGLFFVISALLMVVVEIFRTVRGRSSVARWRFVGRQAAVALGIVVATVSALFMLEVAISGNPLEVRVDTGVASTGTATRGHLVATIAEIPLSSTPVLGTLFSLVLVLGLAEALRWILRRQAYPTRRRLRAPGSSGPGQTVPGQFQPSAFPCSAKLVEEKSSYPHTLSARLEGLTKPPSPPANTRP